MVCNESHTKNNKDMKETTSIQILMKRQKAFQNAIMVMQKKKNKIDNLISAMLCQEIRTKQEHSEEDDIMTKQEVCEMLGISSSTLYRMRLNGFPFKKIRGRKSLLFSRKDVENYISNKRHSQNWYD